MNALIWLLSWRYTFRWWRTRTASHAADRAERRFYRES